LRGCRLIAVSLLAGISIPAGSGLAATPRQPAPPFGGIGVRLIPLPGSRSDPFARSYIVGQLAPGARIRRQIEVSNTTRASANVSVYPAAASLRRGRFAFAPGHSRNDLTQWISLTRKLLRLPAGTKALETLTIKVPKQANSGERYAVVWAEVSAPAANGVRLVNRVGVRMYVSIGPGGTATASFVIGPVRAARSATGEPLVIANIHNDGGRTLALTGTLTLSSGPGGLRAGPYPVRLKTPLTPGSSEQATVQLNPSLPRGPWRANLVLRSGEVRRTAAATIEFPNHHVTTKQPTGEAQTHHPILLAVIFLALLAAAAFLLLRSRRNRPRVDR
jgi:hypothetical protein